MRLNLPAKACLLEGTRCHLKDIVFPAGLVLDHRFLCAPAVPAVGLYSTAVAGKSDGVTPRAPAGLGHAVTIPGA